MILSLDAPFNQITVILAISIAVGFLILRLRQPLLAGFIAVGILAGPSGLDFLSAHEPLRLFAELGIAVLLFLVGLKLDIHLIRTTGPVALAAGLVQIVFTWLLGFLIALALGMEVVESAYVGVALTFSSTIVVVKLLSDKREIDSLHGRIAIGLLIVQDIAAVLAMIGLTALGASSGEAGVVREALWVLAKGAALIGGLALLMRYVLPPLLDQIARSQEFLVLFAIGWAVLLSAAGEGLGFSREVGAFLGGVTLASTSYREAIGSRLVSLRDFLLIFFFINLGAQLDLSSAGSQIGVSALLAAFVLIGKPLIVLAAMGTMGYRKRTGFLAGLTLAQISEFSLILGAIGVKLGHIRPDTMGLITLIGLITIGLSTYLILYSHWIYSSVGRHLGLFERKIRHREEAEDTQVLDGAEILLFGLGRYGRNIARHLLQRRRTVLGVDFDPQAVAECRAEGIPLRYGDAEDPEILEHLPLDQARWVVNTAPGRDANLTLLTALKSRGYRGKVVLTAHQPEDASFFEETGADKVLRPFEDAAEQAVDILSAATDELQETYPWPVTMTEVRIRPGSAAAGRRVGELALRSRTGASIIAVDRAGRNLFDVGAEFQLFPGDRLVLVGPPESLERASTALQEMVREDAGGHALGVLRLSEKSLWVGFTLAHLDLRGNHGVNVLGIERGDQKIVSPAPDEVLQVGDLLIVAGRPEVVDRLNEAHGTGTGGMAPVPKTQEPE